jgi:hypothetical protein
LMKILYLLHMKLIMFAFIKKSKNRCVFLNSF